MTLKALEPATPFVAEYRFEAVGGRPWPVTRFTLDAEVRGGSVYRAFGPAFLPLLRLSVRRRLRPQALDGEFARLSYGP
jgi:hypothetical protein